ncbi:MAG: hypothetical protein RR231_14005 [Acinetobacter sp.]
MGTSQGVVLAKLENVVLLDVDTIPAQVVGGKYKKLFTFAPIQGISATKGAVRFDMYDVSTGEYTQGNDIIVDFSVMNTAVDANLTGSQKTYSGITPQKKDKMLDALRNSGASVVGNNPWNVDLHKYGIKLRGCWNAECLTMSIEIVAKSCVIPPNKIWSTIDGMIAQL